MALPFEAPLSLHYLGASEISSFASYSTLSNSKLTITSPQLLIAVDRSRFGEFDSGDLN